MIYLALACIAVLAFLLWRETRRSDALLAAHAAERADWQAARDEERAEWGTERRQLLNRIQRPEAAVYDDFEPSLEKPYVGHDDDEAYWEAVKNGGS